MLKIKNTKHLDTAEEIFTEFLDKFQKYAAEAAEISKGKGNLSPADKLKALECLETRYAALSNFFTGELGYEVRLLRALPAIETPWDDAFHRLYCSSCSAADCDDCRRPERDSPLWWLGLPAAEVEK